MLDSCGVTDKSLTYMIKKRNVHQGLLSLEIKSVVRVTHTTVPTFTLIHFRSVNPTVRVQPLTVYLTPNRWVIRSQGEISFRVLTMSLKVSIVCLVYLITTSSLSGHLNINLAGLSWCDGTCPLSVWVNPLSKDLFPHTLRTRMISLRSASSISSKNVYLI